MRCFSSRRHSRFIYDPYFVSIRYHARRRDRAQQEGFGVDFFEAKALAGSIVGGLFIAAAVFGVGPANDDGSQPSRAIQLLSSEPPPTRQPPANTAVPADEEAAQPTPKGDLAVPAGDGDEGGAVYNGPNDAPASPATAGSGLPAQAAGALRTPGPDEVEDDDGDSDDGRGPRTAATPGAATLRPPEPTPAPPSQLPPPEDDDGPPNQPGRPAAPRPHPAPPLPTPGGQDIDDDDDDDGGDADDSDDD